MLPRSQRKETRGERELVKQPRISIDENIVPHISDVVFHHSHYMILVVKF